MSGERVFRHAVHDVLRLPPQWWWSCWCLSCSWCCYTACAQLLHNTRLADFVQFWPKLASVFLSDFFNFDRKHFKLLGIDQQCKGAFEPKTHARSLHNNHTILAKNWLGRWINIARIANAVQCHNYLSNNKDCHKFRFSIVRIVVSVSNVTSL